METKYFCEICGTKPDQLSHHRAHLQTQKHKDNAKLFITDMKIFSVPFKQFNPKKWHETEYKNYIADKYCKATDRVSSLANGEWEEEQDIEWVSNWIIREAFNNTIYDWSSECFDCKELKKFYQQETGNKLDEIERFDINFSNWAIDKILKYKENMTVKSSKTKLLKNKDDIFYKRDLSRHTNVNFNKIKEIRNGLIDLRYLSKPKHILTSDNCDIELYNDDAIRYSCILFDNFGVHSLCLIYNEIAGLHDLEIDPEYKKENTFYFYKEVDIEYTTKIPNVTNYGETRTEKKKIWTSIDIGDFTDYLYYLDDPENEKYKDNIPDLNYSYISDNDFKYFIKESLVEVFTEKMEYSNKAIKTLEAEQFRTNWLKYYEKLYYHRGEKCYYIINNSDITYYSNKKNRECVVDICIYDSEKYESFDNYALINNDTFDTKTKLTQEQTDEFLNFIHKTENEIKLHEEYVQYYKNELLKIKDISLTSDTIKSMYHICQYLFVYDEELIEYYKNHMYIAHANIQKERMEKIELESGY
jgi:hypothetical protein